MSISRFIFDNLISILEDGAYSNLALKGSISHIDESGRRLITATVHVTLENLRYIDYLIKAYAKGKLDKRIKYVLRIGFARAVFMRAPLSAVCSETVNLAREIGKAALCGYVNGVMRALCRDIDANTLPALPDDKISAMGIELGYPDFLVREYTERFGLTEARAIMSVKHLPMSLRPQYPYTALEFEEALNRDGIAFKRGTYYCDSFKFDSGFNPLKSSLFNDGSITVQSESSCLTCLAAQVRPGMRVLDVCAAPGGKTALFYSLMQGKGEIVAWDIHPHRVELINNTLERLHVSNVSTAVQDARVFVPEYAESFDVVLVDAPCSGLGIINKPDIRLRIKDSDIDELADLQSDILRVASKYVKPSGTLIYSTCTISKRENESIINNFLYDAPFERGCFTGLPDSLASRAVDGMLMLRPDMDGTEGFFIAKLVRRLK